MVSGRGGAFSPRSAPLCHSGSGAPGALTNMALNKPLLSISWNHGCAVVASPECHLPQVGFQCSVAAAALVWDTNNGGGRWGASTPFSFTAPSGTQERRHLEGEGQIVKNIYVINRQGLMGCGCAGERREGGAGVRFGGGSHALTCLAVRWVSATGLLPSRGGSVWL